jgi:hypothetical protein
MLGSTSDASRRFLRWRIAAAGVRSWGRIDGLDRVGWCRVDAHGAAFLLVENRQANCTLFRILCELSVVPLKRCRHWLRNNFSARAVARGVTQRRLRVPA